MRPSIAAILLPAVLFAQSDVKAARKAFDNALSAQKKNQTEEAVRGLESAVALDPRFAEAWSALGRLQLRLQRPVEARKSLEKAIEVDPGLPDPYTPLAAILQAAHEWKAVLEVTDRLLKLDAFRYPTAWLLNATAHYNLRDFAAAEKSAREAVRLDRKHQQPKSMYLLAEIAVARNDYPAAAAHMKEYLRFISDPAEMARTRDRIAQIERGLAAGAAEPTRADFRAQTDLTLVRFQVSPAKGQFLDDLRPEDIQVLENGVPQKLSIFEGGVSIHASCHST